MASPHLLFRACDPSRLTAAEAGGCEYKKAAGSVYIVQHPLAEGTVLHVDVAVLLVIISGIFSVAHS